MRKREHFIGLWLDDREYKHLLKQCSISGLNTSALIRHSVMGVEILPRPPDACAALLRELSAIGNNINQIAHNTNAKKEAEAAEVDEAVKLVYQALRLVKEAL
ncbi:plasmid mobilization relaxosome protein MobC [uncultured Oscillibacter sp.]|uniref:plasmid mobilization protein n=1 Tax=uncultured Oscillibacter sp. TaxID=876091 RepID=UPI0025EDE8B7|nr:plasmid mobilization relaxosome protein MobC [uncultured Oscillibacter sp.]